MTLASIILVTKGRTLSDIEESILNNVIRPTDVGMAHHLIQDII